MRGVSRCLVLALAVLAGACSSPSTPPAETIQVSDSGVFQPVLRASMGPSRAGREDSDPHTGHAVELGYTSGSGGGAQSLASGYISLGGRTFNAPATLQYDVDVRYVDIAYRWRQVFGERTGIGYEALAGAAIAELDITARAGGLRGSQGLSSPGLALGFGPLFRVRRGTSLHLRGHYFRSGDDNGVTDVIRWDAYLLQALGSSMALRAGYSAWHLQSDRGGTTSPIEVRLRGPALGLELMF